MQPVPVRVAAMHVKISKKPHYPANRCSVLHNAIPILARTPNVQFAQSTILILFGRAVPDFDAAA